MDLKQDNDHIKYTPCYTADNNCRSRYLKKKIKVKINNVKIQRVDDCLMSLSNSFSILLNRISKTFWIHYTSQEILS